MFTSEIRINGTLILHIYGINIGFNKEGLTKYDVKVYKTEKSKIRSMIVYHDRRDGIEALIESILCQYRSAK